MTNSYVNLNGYIRHIDVILEFPNGVLKEYDSRHGIRGCKEDGQRPTSAYVFGKIEQTTLERCIPVVLHPMNQTYYFISDEDYNRDEFEFKNMLGYYDDCKCSLEELILFQLLED